MLTAFTIVFIGCTVFLSHYFAAMFARTKIPDVLWLFTLGLLLGPIGHVVRPETFGAVGPVFTTITLIFILFESGIDQRLEPLIHSLSGTAKITTYNFAGTCLVAGGIIYGIVEVLNYSGPIAALAFGITLGNIDVLGPPIMKNVISRKPISLTEHERAFFSEAVFLLRTFFFVYIGISVRLTDWRIFTLGAIITGALFLIRIPIVRISVPRDTPPKDAAFMASMIPKGLGAAVLASLPAQQGIPGGEVIQSVVFSIILCSTMFTTILTFLVDKTWLSNVYTWIFRLTGLGKVVVEALPAGGSDETDEPTSERPVP